MYKTFDDFIKDSINESEGKAGNYVSIGASLHQENIDLRGGIFNREAHATLMYSEFTEVDLKTVQEVLDTFQAPITAKFEGVEVFDDSGNPGNAAVVLRISSPFLNEIHTRLQQIGLKHSYDFSPHITYAYRLDSESAKLMQSDLNGIYEGMEFVLSGFDNTEVNKNWIDNG